MKYYVTILLTNQEGQDAPSITVKESRDAALVTYHNTLAAYHNAPDVRYAVVMLMNEYGNTELKEIVDHTPAPEPEPEA